MSTVQKFEKAHKAAVRYALWRTINKVLTEHGHEEIGYGDFRRYEAFNEVFIEEQIKEELKERE